MKFKINKKINQKSAVSLVAIITYIFVSLAILGLVASFANQYIIQYQEQYKYNTMINEISKLDLKLNNISNNKLNSEIVKVNNSEYLEIDCTNNIINGYINYNQNYKDSNVYIQGINTYKKFGKIYFEKKIDTNNSINLDCKNLVLNKGRNNLELNYFDFNESNGEINIDILRYKNTIDNFWYNSNWPYRSKITINSNDVNGNLESFPVFLKVTDYNILSNINSDGSDIVFTKDNGKTKLKREIENVSNNILPYYIEEDIVDNNYNVWTKTSVLANSTKTIYLEKTNGYSPNGDNIFLFFDDFDTNILDINKWDDLIYIEGSSGSTINVENNILEIYTSSGSLTLYPTKYNFKDAIVEYKLKTITETGLTNPDRALFWRFQNLNQFYFAGWECWDADSFTIGKNQSGWIELIRSSSYIDDGNWHKFIIDINNTKFNLNYDSQDIINTEDTVNNSSGPFGFMLDGKYSSSREVEAKVDDLFVRKYAETEPIIILNKINNNLYKINIINTTDYDLEDYQIKIPGDNLNINSKTQSLKLLDSELITWVKIDELSSTLDTDIYMYYGNNNANEVNSNYVWNENYIMVQHLNKSPTNDIVGHFDSTSNNINGVAKNFNFDENSTTNATGKINRADKFDGTNDYIDCNTIVAKLFDKKITIEGWLKIDSHSNYNGLTTLGGIFPVGETGVKIYFDSSGDTAFIIADGIDRSTTAFNYTFLEDTWYHIVFTAEIGGDKKLYVNGVLEDTKDISTLTGTFNKSLANRIVTSDYFDGSISEFNISNNVQTYEWIKTQYNNQHNINSFLNIEEIERY